MAYSYIERCDYKINDDLTLVALFVTNRKVDYYVVATSDTLYEDIEFSTMSWDSYTYASGLKYSGNIEGKTTFLLGSWIAGVGWNEPGWRNLYIKTADESVYVHLSNLHMAYDADNKRVQMTNILNFDDESDTTMLLRAKPSNYAFTIGALKPGSVLDYLFYKEISISPYNNWITYSYQFSDAEREKLRAAYPNAVSNTVTFSLKTKQLRKIYYRQVYGGSKETLYSEHISEYHKEAILNIVNCTPIFSPEVKDVNARTVYLSGDENKFIKYKSIAAFNTGATAIKGASLVSQYIINGTQTINDLATGEINGVDSNTFYFSATDTRGVTGKDFLVRDLIPYVKLTSSITEVDVNAVEGTLTFTVEGNYFNDTFGAVENSLEFEYSIIKDDGEIEWIIFEATPHFNGNSYSVSHTITGLSYTSTYTITVNVIDELMNAETEAKVVSFLPVFDWSKNDFRHNTLVNFQEDIQLAQGKAIRGINDNNLTLNDDININSENSINLNAQDSVFINGKEYGSNKVLWSGASHMNGNQSITLSDTISNQANGIVLVFSLYRNNAAENVSINTAFISKYQVEALSGAPHTFLMAVNAGFSIIGAKYLYISNDSITGHEGNTASGTNSGITYNNSNYVLRYVIGV